MPRPCSVCVHPDRWAIDEALTIGNVSHRQVAERYGFSPSAVDRHVKQGHLPGLMGKIVQRVDALEAEQLNAQLVHLLDEAYRALAEASRADVSLAVRLKAIREARMTVESLARMSMAMTGPSESKAERVDLDAEITARLRARDAAAEVQTPVDVQAEEPSDWKAQLLSLPAASAQGDASTDDDVVEAVIVDDE